MTSKILVTGAAGFIGSNLVDRLISDGHNVVGLDDLSSGKRENLPDDFDLLVMDIRSEDTHALIKEMEPEVVFHLAAQISVAVSAREPKLDADINVGGSLNILDAIGSTDSTSSTRFVHFSSGGTVYGEPEYLPARESTPLSPLAPYAASKSAVEIYLPVFERLYAIESSTVRLGNVYGPRQDPHGEAGVIAIFTRAMLDGKEMKIFGDGFDERDYVFVDDVIDALVTVGLGTRTGIFNIASGVGTNPNTLYGMLAELTGHTKPAVHGEPRPGDINKIYLDVSKAKRELGWEPKVSLEEGLRRTVDWFKSH